MKKEQCVDKRVLRSDRASKAWETRGAPRWKKRFPVTDPWISLSLSYLPSCYSSRMRMSAATMILHSSYDTQTLVLPFTPSIPVGSPLPSRLSAFALSLITSL